MKIQTDPPLHLTYCLNVHPGETWAENLAAIRETALRVRDRVAGGRAFGLGLRLSVQAADELARPEALAEFRAFLAGENCYVFTINGFPYGRFHRTRVKQDVYKPDWRTTQRRDYTLALAEVLATLVPEGVAGSISTVPCSYKPWITSGEDVRRMVRMLCDVVARLAAIREETGRTITLALEPEPDCYLENTDEVIAFFRGPLREHGLRMLGQQGFGATAAEAALREHLGVCFDTSHLAVAFESPAEALARLVEAGVAVCKVHLSAALRAAPTPAALRRLAAFGDEVYLHQVKVRRADGTIASHPDLPDAMRAADAEHAAEWRVHFHVPLFFGGDEALQSTRSLLLGDFAAALRAGATEHLEIETYTFGVLPAEMAITDTVDGIAREYGWVLGDLLTPR